MNVTLYNSINMMKTTLFVPEEIWYHICTFIDVPNAQISFVSLFSVFSIHWYNCIASLIKGLYSIYPINFTFFRGELFVAYYCPEWNDRRYKIIYKQDGF